MSWFEWREAPEGEYAVIGDPVSHSASPRMHAAIYRELGLDWRYRAVRVPAGEVGAALGRLRELGYRGVNATVPLKEEVFVWCRETEGIAGWVGAVNTVDLDSGRGVNTDAPGFLRTLEAFGVEPGATVLVLGAGGTARALIPAMREAGYRLRAWNRTKSKMLDLAAEFAPDMMVLDEIDPAGCEVVLNTTSASLGGEGLAVDWSRSPEAVLAYDMMYGEEPTAFLRGAAAAERRGVDGSQMLVEQGALSFEWWTGKPAPREAMLRAVHERTESHSGSD